MTKKFNVGDIIFYVKRNTKEIYMSALILEVDLDSEVTNKHYKYQAFVYGDGTKCEAFIDNIARISKGRIVSDGWILSKVYYKVCQTENKQST